MSHLCQKARFLNFMITHIIKPKNEGTLLGYNEDKNEEMI